MKIRKASTIYGLRSHARYRIKGGYIMADVTMKQAQAILKAALNKAEEW